MNNDIKAETECPICGGGVINEAMMHTSRGALSCKDFYKRVCYHANKKGKIGCINPQREQLKNTVPESLPFAW